jgi:tetratricopeptide (TPR) repeat protein
LLAFSAGGKAAAQAREPDPQASHYANQLAEIAQTGPDLTLWQAQRAIVAGFLSSSNFIEGDPGSFRFSLAGFEFNATPLGHRDSRHFSVDLTALPRVVTKRGFGAYRLKNEAGKDLPDPLAKLEWSGNDQQTAELVANALNHLRDMAGEQGAGLRDFSRAATAWRALATKPPIPEAVRAQRLLAETALKEKKLAQALVHYERGVELDPVWPEGRFNAALVAAELEYYDEAVEQMRAYVELAPNAPDAQDARDNIAIWQDKAAQQVVKSPENQPKRQNGWPGSK